MPSPLSALRFGLYARKSTVQEDRQVLSIDSQRSILAEVIARHGLNVVQEYVDCASAHKVDNRPQFRQMMRDLEQGRIDAILCWKLHRLARNMTEGGFLITELQHSRIKAIITPEKTILPQDNTLLLTLEFGMANQFSLDLSGQVKDGIRTKARQGGLNGRAPLGYLNDRLNKTVVPDPNRFQIVQRLWDHMATGRYSLQALCTLSAEEWGLRTRRGQPLSLSSLYRLLTNPFYYGAIRLHGEIVATGQHQPMVSHRLFLQVQAALQRHGYQTNRIAAYDFAYRGLLSCGSCQCSITAEQKLKYFCPQCRCPQTAKNPHDCKRCGYAFTAKAIAKASRYTYYRCTKKRGPCPEKCLREEKLQQQLSQKLACIDLDQRFAHWLLESMDALEQADQQEIDATLRSLAQQVKALEDRKQRLLDLRLSDEITKEDFSREKQRIEPEHADLCTRLYNLKHRTHHWRPRFQKDVALCLDLSACLAGDDIEAKKAALADLGSNLTLKGREVNVDLAFPFLKIAQLKKALSDRLEPLPDLRNSNDSSGSDGEACVWSSILKEIRTWYMENGG